MRSASISVAALRLALFVALPCIALALPFAGGGGRALYFDHTRSDVMGLQWNNAAASSQLTLEYWLKVRLSFWRAFSLPRQFHRISKSSFVANLFDPTHLSLNRKLNYCSFVAVQIHDTNQEESLTFAYASAQFHDSFGDPTAAGQQ